MDYFTQRALFYHDLGFQKRIISDTLSYFNTNGFGFYLQKAYVKDWIDNKYRYWNDSLFSNSLVWTKS